LTRDDYQEPFDPDLLWVYEGLTSYLGDVLTARSGLWSPEYARDSLALIAAGLENRPGRSWRPLVDTARAAYTLYGVAPEWRSWRRGVDFYEEGVLIWLEVDSAIRALSDDARSLDDFCAAFFAGAAGEPQLSPTATRICSRHCKLSPRTIGRASSRSESTRGARAPLGIERGLEARLQRSPTSRRPTSTRTTSRSTCASRSASCSKPTADACSTCCRVARRGRRARAGAELVAVNRRRW
jgi:hypothetical protein